MWVVVWILAGLWGLILLIELCIVALKIYTWHMKRKTLKLMEHNTVREAQLYCMIAAKEK